MPLTPKNRKEEWLEGLVEHETTLTPKNRCEAWMKEIIDASGGGGGGTGGGVLIVHEDLDTGYLDKTWQEIFDTLASETPVYFAASDINNASMLAIVKASSLGGYKLYLQAMSDPFAEAESADDYPLDLDF